MSPGRDRPFSDSTPPNPGSIQARQHGCLCPVLDNAYGRGARLSYMTSQPEFWVNEDCPLHGVTA